MYALSKNIAPENNEKVFNKDVIWRHFCFEKDWKEHQNTTTTK